ncbi:chloride channel protein [Haploplasma axanthum]|uniref:H(+)/Cl(-) exchange transporter ClcA n=1 Tax=Haploplasma axanthum TaxID=29552 RepID=A0A449BDE6_HAPAX|nr:chloride channel protein [Haploplasma axanthum]VEU80483.1 H(+)/Cl(-) exchange transporter ClcA [Haploplasma axanthum]
MNHMKNSWNNVLKVILFYGVITGIVSGLILYGFRYIANYFSQYSKDIYIFVRNNPLYIPLFFGGLIFIAFLISTIIDRVPSTAGGAIPRTAGLVRGLLTFKWLPTLIFTMISTLLVFLGGFPLGIEGASVLIGTSISEGVNETLHTKPAFKRYILTSGTSAGFSFATGSLMAGIIFPLEEMHKKFSWMLLTAAMSGAVFSTIVTRSLDAIFNKGSVFFPIQQITAMPIKYLWIAPLIGLITGLFVSLFNYLIELIGKISSERLKNVKRFYKILFAIIIIGIIGLLLPENLGNGHHNIIIELLNNPVHFSLLVLVLLFAAKIITITLSSGSAVTGGLFIPVLVIGVLIGAISNVFLVKMGFNPEYSTAIILIAMGAFFAASMDAPITTLLFIVEASLHVETTLYIVIAIFVSMIVAHLFHAKPLNEIVLKKMMKEQDRNRVWHMYEIKGIINDNAFVVNKTVRDILWPANCLIKELVQSDATNRTNIMVHGGDRVLSNGDHVIFQVQSYNLDETITKLESLVGTQKFDVELK